MKKQLIGLGVAALMFVGVGSAGATTYSYFGYDDFGGTWYDAEKTLSNTDDDLLCWAGTSANMLAWTGWGATYGDDTDAIFAHYQNHWTDAGQHVKYGLDWWFDGTNDNVGSGAQEDVDGGGGFWGSYVFDDYYQESWNYRTSMSTLDSYLHSGYGVGLSIYQHTGDGAHAITAWGYDYDDFGNYIGVYVTDSDNSKNSNSPPDTLNYYEVAYNSDYGTYDLQGGYSDWFIWGVHGLDQAQATPTPEPATMLLFGTGLVGLVGSRIRKKKKKQQ